jgi:hypothetical protein
MGTERADFMLTENDMTYEEYNTIMETETMEEDAYNSKSLELLPLTVTQELTQQQMLGVPTTHCPTRNRPLSSD